MRIPSTTSIKSATLDARNSLSRAKKPLAKLFSAQLSVQVMMLLTGLILMRTLGKTDYAYFTIVNLMLSTMTLLADVGVSSALTAAGGKVWRDDYELGRVMHAGLRIRRRLGLIACLIIFPLTFWMLYSKGDYWLSALVLSFCVVIGSNFQLSIGVFESVPRLRSKVEQLSWGEVVPAFVRFVLTFAACSIFVNSLIAVIITSISFGVQCLLYWNYAREKVPLDAPINPETTAFIWKVVRQQAPATIYYCVNGQLTLFLMSILGKATNIAEVGALGRFTTVFVVLNSLLYNFAAPRFARAQQKKEMLRIYFGIMGAWIVVNIGLVLTVYIGRPYILLLLGKNYQNLSHELMIYILGAAASNISGAIGILNRAKAWVDKSWMAIPMAITWNLFVLWHLDLSKTRDAVIFGALFFVPGLLFNAWRSIYHFRNYGPQPQTA